MLHGDCLYIVVETYNTFYNSLCFGSMEHRMALASVHGLDTADGQLFAYKMHKLSAPTFGTGFVQLFAQTKIHSSCLHLWSSHPAKLRLFGVRRQDKRRPFYPLFYCILCPLLLLFYVYDRLVAFTNKLFRSNRCCASQAIPNQTPQIGKPLGQTTTVHRKNDNQNIF